MKPLATGLLLAALALPVSAQEQAGQPYRPGLGDMMTMTVQPRHIKLWAAGQAKNWVYAAYELHELQEAFERAASVWPVWQSVPVAQMIKAVTQPPLAALDAAIKAKDADKFAATYKQLTEACDTCHQAADRTMVVIKVPESGMYTDQDFAPHP
jgi:hypothetical protein